MQKLLVDENLSPSLVGLATDKGFVCSHVNHLPACGRPRRLQTPSVKSVTLSRPGDDELGLAILKDERGRSERGI